LKLERQSEGIGDGMGNGGFSASCRAAQIERDARRNDGARDREKPMLPFYGASLAVARYVHDHATGRNLRRFIRCNSAHCVFVQGLRGRRHTLHCGPDSIRQRCGGIASCPHARHWPRGGKREQFILERCEQFRAAHCCHGAARLASSFADVSAQVGAKSGN
jgi:hypothetical protein